MLSAKLFIPLALGAVGLVALSGGKAAAKPGAAKPGADAVPPPDLMNKIAAAFQAADPAQCRALADEVERAGFKAQADDLRAFAKRVEDALKTAPVSAPPQTATIPPTVPGASAPARAVPPLTAAQPAAPSPLAAPPITVLPEVVISAAGPSAGQRLLAGKTALMLSKTSKGREDKALVGAFQQQELDAQHAPGGAFGNEPSKRDELYGPKTALQFARHYGIVPPKPFYWSKANWLQQKKDYRAEMQRFAGVDPQRADEWTNAGKVL